MHNQLILEKLKTQTLLLVCTTVRYNNNHDDKGRFTFGSGTGSGGGSSSKKSDTFRDVEPKEFMETLDKAKASQSPEKAWRVDNYSHSEEDYSKDKLFVTKGGSTVAVTPDGDIISVCRNTNDSETHGNDLLNYAVENGGKKLDSFSGNHEFYVENGFEPISWCDFDEDYAPPGWNGTTDKKEPIIFYKYTGKPSSYKDVKSFTDITGCSMDYNSAQIARDDSM